MSLCYVLIYWSIKCLAKFYVKKWEYSIKVRKSDVTDKFSHITFKTDKINVYGPREIFQVPVCLKSVISRVILIW